MARSVFREWQAEAPIQAVYDSDLAFSLQVSEADSFDRFTTERFAWARLQELDFPPRDSVLEFDTVPERERIFSNRM